MTIIKKEVVIIGGGPAGLAAAVKLYDLGIKDLVILEREDEPGGILRQCIHDGFGLTRFGETLSGPEYAHRFWIEAERRGLDMVTNATVVELTKDKLVRASSTKGILEYQAQAVVLAMGCRERTRGAIGIPGSRPAGIYTAGVAQEYINLHNTMVGKEAVILGSGDIGLIMARRLTLEGVNVKGVYEIQSHPSGLDRNIRQCLDDFHIPLYLRHTVKNIVGEGRLKGVEVCQVDETMRPMEETTRFIPCDTLILSVGLIPENELSLQAEITLDRRTKGPLVDAFYQTDAEGIFAAGNVLHVHDLVDFVSLEAEKLAESVARYLKDPTLPPCPVEVIADEHITHTVPQWVPVSGNWGLSLRVKTPMKNRSIVLKQGQRVLLEAPFEEALPAEMIQLEKTDWELDPKVPLEVTVR